MESADRDAATAILVAAILKNQAKRTILRLMPQNTCAFCGLPFEESELRRVGGRWACLACAQSAAAPPVPAAADVRAAEKAPSNLLMPGYEKFTPHPDAFGPVGIALMALGAPIVGLSLGAAYAAFQFYNPFIYVNVVALEITATFAGIATGWLGVLGGTRRNLWLFLFGLLAGLAALYSSWIFFLKLLHDAGWVIAPGAIRALADGLAEQGVWSIKDITPTGWQLKGVWAVEAFLLLLTTGLAATGRVMEGPFCEGCRRSLYPPRLFPRLGVIAQPAAFAATLGAGDLSPLLDLKMIPMGSRDQTEIKLWKCGSCGRLHCLDVIAYSRTGDGATYTPVVEHLTLNREAYDWILKRLLSARDA